MKKKIQQRIQILKSYLKSGIWADPRDPAFTNGFNDATRNEIKFLESLIK